MTAYYNEFDPQNAQWLRELIKLGEIPDGVVDERSIEDVIPNELRDFDQCHFFAGVGVWPAALRRVGWSDARPVWTGSCPCQPFSSAGKGAGLDDPRHLWPAFYHLIAECKPVIVFGEQVASTDGLAWLDIVQADLERAHYACGPLDLCAAGVGAPHIRQRLFFVAERCTDTDSVRSETKRAQPSSRTAGIAKATGEHPSDDVVSAGNLADITSERHDRRRTSETRDRQSTLEQPQRLRDAGNLGNTSGATRERLDRELPGTEDQSSRARHSDGRVSNGHSDAGAACVLEHTASRRSQTRSKATETTGHRNTANSAGGHDRPGPTNGHWRAVDWLHCLDGVWRPVEPGTFPLVNGPAGNVVRSGDICTSLAHGSNEAKSMRIKGYGNAIVLPLAVEFLSAYLEVETME
ncbi:MAG: DNA cytosine methyltransferase [Pseudomonadota bacterium]